MIGGIKTRCEAYLEEKETTVLDGDASPVEILSLLEKASRFKMDDIIKAILPLAAEQKVRELDSYVDQLPDKVNYALAHQKRENTKKDSFMA